VKVKVTVRNPVISCERDGDFAFVMVAVEVLLKAGVTVSVSVCTPEADRVAEESAVTDVVRDTDDVRESSRVCESVFVWRVVGVIETVIVFVVLLVRTSEIVPVLEKVGVTW
jgi:hypothetical protein